MPGQPPTTRRILLSAIAAVTVGLGVTSVLAGFSDSPPIRLIQGIAVFGAGAVLAAYAALTGVGFRAPWVPLLPEGAQLPAAVLAPLDEQGRRGAQLFIDRSCWSCHQVSGSGGQRGPDLTHEGSRLGHDQIITRIANGGGGMPAYAGALSSADLAAITSFLEAQR